MDAEIEEGSTGSQLFPSLRTGFQLPPAFQILASQLCNFRGICFCYVFGTRSCNGVSTEGSVLGGLLLKVVPARRPGWERSRLRFVT